MDASHSPLILLLLQIADSQFKNKSGSSDYVTLFFVGAKERLFSIAQWNSHKKNKGVPLVMEHLYQTTFLIVS